MKEGMRHRKSITTGRIADESRLVRFVLDPASTVVPDIGADLPGRGAWVEASRSSIEEAVKKKLFNRAFKQTVVVEPGLADRVEAHLRAKVLSLIGLARKSGDLEVGLHNVLKALAKSNEGLLFAAYDGSLRSRNEVKDQLARSAAPGNRADTPHLVEVFSRSELGLALGRDSVVHVFVKNKGLLNRIRKELDRLQKAISMRS